MATTKIAQRGAAASAKATDREETAEREETGGQQEAPHRRTATVNLPFVTAEFRAPEIHVPSVRAPERSDLTGAASAIRSYLPSPAQAAYYAGLGALGVLELVEWPVVLAIGVGTALVQRQAGSRQAERQAGRQAEPAEPAESAERGEPSRETESGKRSGENATAQK